MLIKREGDKIVIVLVYVDDLLLTGYDHSMIQHTKVILHTTFKIKYLGELRYFFGIEFTKNEDGILMHQRKYALELIAEMGFAGAKPVTTPMKQNQKLTTIEFDQHTPSAYKDLLLGDPTSYQKLIGRLLYLTTTRYDIAFVVQSLSQFMHSPQKSHMEVALRLVRYVKHAPGLGILMSATGDDLLKIIMMLIRQPVLIVGDTLLVTWCTMAIFLFHGS